MTSRFDLEQDILNTWRIVEDLNTFYDKFDTLTEDEQMNFLLGITVLYELKFQRTFENFEKVCKELCDTKRRLETYEKAAQTSVQTSEDVV